MHCFCALFFAIAAGIRQLETPVQTDAKRSYLTATRFSGRDGDLDLPVALPTTTDAPASLVDTGPGGKVALDEFQHSLGQTGVGEKKVLWVPEPSDAMRPWMQEAIKKQQAHQEIFDAGARAGDELKDSRKATEALENTVEKSITDYEGTVKKLEAAGVTSKGLPTYTADPSGTCADVAHDCRERVDRGLCAADTAIQATCAKSCDTWSTKHGIAASACEKLLATKPPALKTPVKTLVSTSLRATTSFDFLKQRQYFAVFSFVVLIVYVLVPKPSFARRKAEPLPVDAADPLPAQ